MGPQNNTSTVIYPPSSFLTVPFASPFFDSDLSKSIFIVMVISLLSEDDHVCGCMDVWVLVSWKTCILTRNDACHNHFGWKGVNLFSHVDRRRGDRQKNVNCPDVNWRMKYGCTLHTILPRWQYADEHQIILQLKKLRKTFRQSPIVYISVSKVFC